MVIDFPDSSVRKESACNAGDLDLIPELGRSPREAYSVWCYRKGTLSLGNLNLL